MAEPGTKSSDLLVIFGITGDLARKMTFQALYRLERRELLECPIVGVASDDISVDELVKRARKAIEGAGEKIDDEVFDRLAGRLSYLHGDVTDSRALRRAGQADRLEAPLPVTTWRCRRRCSRRSWRTWAKPGCWSGSRVAVEKPFGHDLTSARELNERLRAVLDEDQIFRVDHFLGKEPVVELEYLRFGNLALAELWDRHSISEIQITMAENFGVDDRGKFYDGVGALRDVVQNHLLQVLAGVAMEPPVGPSADDLNDKKADVLRAMPAIDPERCVRGQYRGYTDVDGVAKDSYDRDLRRAAGGDRQLALGRGADLPAGGQGAARAGHRGAVVHPPGPVAGVPAGSPTGRAQPDRAAHRPRSRAAAAADRARRRPLARPASGLVVHGMTSASRCCPTSGCCTPR